ncbi:MAG TPA: glycosyltransferase family 39 protein [Bryobacteraceae bacterium]|nr:glycosyltransferase family 39 protein [Bryobacteraceae bacterium]
MAPAVLSVAGCLGYVIDFFDNNENMYVASGVLAKTQTLYRDFAFVQTPFVPLFYAAVYRGSSTIHYLLTAKVVTWVLWVVSGILIFSIGRKVAGDVAGAVTVTLYVTNPSLLRSVAECSNYIAPIPFALLAILLVLPRCDSLPTKKLYWYFAGIAIGISILAKLYLLILVPAFVLAVLCEPESHPAANSLQRLAHLALGILSGVSPAIWYLVRYPRQFVFDNFWYHRTTTKLLLSRTIPARLPNHGLQENVPYIVEHLTSGPSLCLFIGISLLIVTILASPGALRRLKRDPLTYVAALTAAASLLGVAVDMFMVPCWPQYLSLPVPFLLVLFVVLWKWANVQRERFLHASMAVLAFWAVAGSSTEFYRGLRSLAHINESIAFRIHAQSEQIRKIIPPAYRQRKVWTLQPVYAVESSLPIYPQLATGIFTYQIGDAISSAERKSFVISSPRTVENTLSEDPPSAIVVGSYGEYHEGPLVQYAQSHGYKPHQITPGLITYLAPDM